MTKEDGRCDGKNCDHHFEKREDYVYRADNPDEIYCTRECAMSWYEDPFRYGTFGEDE